MGGISPTMADQERAAGSKPPRSLRSRVVAAAVAAIGGRAAQHAIRLGANLVLTRLLFPEAFGVMAIVNALLVGLAMFSDIGVGPSIIQSRRGYDTAFLNTAWTIQVIRGVAIAVFTVALAVPMARAYDEPMLVHLILIASLDPLILGFLSTSIHTLGKELAQGKLMLIEVTQQLARVGTAIGLAFYFREVWVLPVGSAIGAATHVLLSHIVSKKPRNRFVWEAEASREIYRFGRWIFVGSFFHFVANRADRLVMGQFVDMAQLGIFSIASALASIAYQLQDTLMMRVLFPAYSQLKDKPSRVFRSRVARARLAIMGGTLPFLWLLAVFGAEIIAFLYDDRYHEAGWILELLAVGAVIRVVPQFGPVHLARGNSFHNALITGTQGFTLIACILIGGWLYQMQGIVMGIVLSQLLNYPVLAWVGHRHGVWMPLYDIAGLGISALILLPLMLAL
jgi:O-antigen/teichoic acid export membrane protein